MGDLDDLVRALYEADDAADVADESYRVALSIDGGPSARTIPICDRMSTAHARVEEATEAIIAYLRARRPR